MDELERQRLLDACAEAQRRYEEATTARVQAFAETLRTPVTYREVSEVTGLPISTLRSIMRRA